MTEKPQSFGGSILPGRLTTELILRSPQYMSPCRDYEIDLRGNKITVIENLAATENQFDSIDLSDNSIVKLEGFPRLLRLKQLLLCNNRITRIATNLGDQIPNVATLILTNNRIERLQDLDSLQSLKKLQHLSLLENPVTKHKGYRLYVVSRCPGLKWLDFVKVKAAEREEASRRTAFEEDAAPAAAGALMDTDEGPGPQAEAAGPDAPLVKKPPTKEQLALVRAALVQAQTMDEVRELEAALEGGVIPQRILEKRGAGGV